MVMPRTADPEVHRREILHWRAGALITVVLLVVGSLEALLWSRIAPGEQFYVNTSGQFGGLPTESYHQFADVAIFELISVCVAVSAASAIWRWRAIRGTVTALTMAGANLLGALAAYLLGPVFASGVDPASVGAVSAQTVVTAPPTMGNVLLVVVQPAVAVAVYTFLAAWNGRPDLARHELPPTLTSSVVRSTATFLARSAAGRRRTGR